MTEYFCLISIVFMQFLVSLAQDVPPSVSCNMELLTWNKAVESCRNKGDTMLSFRTSLGIDIDKLGLTNEIDVWTADSLTRTNDLLTHVSGSVELCGFNYLNNTHYYNRKLLYGYCNANRNYFCKNDSGHLIVHNGTRENIQCSYHISINDLYNFKSVIKSGFYWTFDKITGKEVEGTGTSVPYLCGAYGRNIGKYYDRCDRHRFSLCNGTGSKGWLGQIDMQCFDVQTTKEITVKTTFVTKTEQLTSSSEISTETFSTSTTEQPIIAVSTEVRNESIEEKMQTKEESKDIGIKVGISVGIVLPVICGILITIYIYRNRIKCWKFCKQIHENGRMNHFHAQEASRIHDQANVYTESRKDTPISPDLSAEYAVVMNPKKDKTSLNLKKHSEKTFYNKTYDEYDTTINSQSVTSNSSNNVYNHLESDDYNTLSISIRQDEHNNMYDTTTRSSLVESDYDSTTQATGTASPDDVYNHLPQNENYYDSTSNTRKKI